MTDGPSISAFFDSGRVAHDPEALKRLIDYADLTKELEDSTRTRVRETIEANEGEN